jgi:predicted RNA-binding protein associated with RNAse of E/G family
LRVSGEARTLAALHYKARAHSLFVVADHGAAFHDRRDNPTRACFIALHGFGCIVPDDPLRAVNFFFLDA